MSKLSSKRKRASEVEEMIVKACKYLTAEGISTKTPKKEGEGRLAALVLRINRDKGKLTAEEWFKTSVSKVALEAFQEWAKRQPQHRIQQEYVYWRHGEKEVPTAAQVRKRCPGLPKSFAEARSRMLEVMNNLAKNGEKHRSNHNLRIT